MDKKIQLSPAVLALRQGTATKVDEIKISASGFCHASISMNNDAIFVGQSLALPLDRRTQ